MSFQPEKVEANRPDGYWIEAFPFKVGDTIPFLIGYGLGTSKAPSNIEMFINPYSPGHQYVPLIGSFGTRHLQPSQICSRKAKGSWDKRTLATLEFPVALRRAPSGSSLFIVLIYSNSYADVSRNGFNDGVNCPPTFQEVG